MKMIIYWTTQNLVSFKLSLEKKLKLTFGALHLKETDSPFWSSLVQASQYHLPQDDSPSSAPGCTCKLSCYQTEFDSLLLFHIEFL